MAHRQPDELRLTTDIEGLQAWVDRHKPSESAKQAHAPKARAMPAIPDVPSGYEYLHIAEREAVHGLDKEKRRLRAQSMREEVESKLKDSWRGKAMFARSRLSGMEARDSYTASKAAAP